MNEIYLVELEGRGGVALNKHVAAGGLVFHCAVLLLDLHNPSTFESSVVNASYNAPGSTYFGGPGSPIGLSGTEGLSSLLSHSDFSSPAASLLPRLL